MNAYVTDLSVAGRIAPATHTASRIETFLQSTRFDRPTLVLDIQAVTRQFHALKAGLGRAHIHYAVKANPQREIIEELVHLGSGFDAASRAEIELCLSLGASPDQISFGNTVKRANDIEFAHYAGITLFAADAEEELEKIASKTRESGFTIVPLRLYFLDSRAKVEIAIARGKKDYDKRQSLREKQDNREALRAMREKNRGQ